MKISVFFTPHGMTQADVAGRPVLVLDILRATTTIVAALASGARAVLPAATVEDAMRLAQSLDRGTVLLAGEQRMERIPGFDLGNSPLEMTPEVVSGKMVVLATTNGTPALAAADPGRPVIVGAATNFRAAATEAGRVFEEQGELVILCAGRERQFALEDAYAAGRFAQAVMPTGQRRAVELNDAAIAALALVRRYGDKWKRAVTASTAAGELDRLGFKADVAAASEGDKVDLVPVYAEKNVTTLNRG